MLDFHNHLMPAVDDGAADIDEARHGLVTLAEHGVTTIITTPHIRASLTLRRADLDRYLSRLDHAYDMLATLVATEFPSLRLDRGVEMMLDVPAPVLEDPRLRLAGSSFVLVEFPFMNIPPHSTLPIRELTASGISPVIAHPERYANMATNLDLIESWTGAGAFIQVNSGSLVGQYGNAARRIAWQLLEEGKAHYLSSDYHSRGRCPVKASASALEERGAAETLHALTVMNPARILRSEKPAAPSPVKEAETGFWRKVFRA